MEINNFKHLIIRFFIISRKSCQRCNYKAIKCVALRGVNTRGENIKLNNSHSNF